MTACQEYAPSHPRACFASSPKEIKNFLHPPFYQGSTLGKNAAPRICLPRLDTLRQPRLPAPAMSESLQTISAKKGSYAAGG